MLATVVGKRIAWFTSKEDGRTVEFARLYITYEDGVEGLEGIIAEEVKVKPEMLRDVQVGEFVEVYYNKFGKVSEVRPAS